MAGDDRRVEALALGLGRLEHVRIAQAGFEHRAAQGQIGLDRFSLGNAVGPHAGHQRRPPRPLPLAAAAQCHQFHQSKSFEQGPATERPPRATAGRKFPGDAALERIAGATASRASRNWACDCSRAWQKRRPGCFSRITPTGGNSGRSLQWPRRCISSTASWWIVSSCCQRESKAASKSFRGRFSPPRAASAASVASQCASWRACWAASWSAVKRAIALALTDSYSFCKASCSAWSLAAVVSCFAAYSASTAAFRAL